MFQKITPKDLDFNVFSAIGDQWMLITAGTAEACNTMTASWGALGVLWGVPMATVYIRPQRYTREFMEQYDTFTLSFFPEAYRKELGLCGAKSGREIDKISACGFHVAEGAMGVPYFLEAETVLVCRKRYVQRLDALAIPQAEREKWYPEADYHYVYLGEIVEALKKD